VGLLRYQKALVHFTTALASDAIMLERLARDAHDNLFNLDRDLMDDVTVEFRQAIEMTKIQEEILSQMMDAFASIISNNLNVVVKVLTALTIVLTIPTMVASFYGMNVNLPGQHHPAAFLGTVLISLLGAAILALWFWRKRWL
jgi:magnesium transporter